ncbi:putative RNA binding protein YcfA (HicA-like mRNA interferase family) [Tumebacillus sp. BK434]|uniref:type II toxin-antitoxin system HicA family toxin n=1 Tax=Tumebacillus sp. BK434 TaxID=2512169 RepID=UPI001052EB34|nr:type II toxin-antitoxin system HicA family toxin [Tumebacillus sp. BK434]TCP57605.1 putative RNA binding protein YcfA (HicA-like mRNA interferase family) [Tumebacillus sp. BK434]
MPPIPRIPASLAVKAFQKAGWVVARIKGSHHILIKPGSPLTLSIPDHGKETVGLGLLKRQISNAGLTVEEFIALLDEL